MPRYNNFDGFHDVTILESEKMHFKHQICKFSALICWRNDSNAISLNDLLSDANENRDGGFLSLSRFFDSTCFNDWIILAKITTRLYNRDHSGDLLCVIRMAE